MSEQMFELAARKKLRFVESGAGSISVEDLWDLPLTSKTGRANLDEIAIALSRQLKDSGTESFVVKASSKNEELQLRFDVVKHVITVRLAEMEKAQQARATSEKKQKLLELIAQKKDSALSEKSVEELEAMVASL